jgi:surfeit locus 1 family protein
MMDVRGQNSPTRIKSIAFGVFLLGCVALFLSLGCWQLQRLVWKRDLIARVGLRVDAPAVAAPAPDSWASVTMEHDAYRHITAHGIFLNNQETLVAASTVHGVGYWVVTPLKADAGFIVFVNRGFVPPERRYRQQRADSEETEGANVTGLLRMTEPNGRFFRHNDPASGRWYSRDVVALAASHNLSNVAPYFIDADATPNPSGFPIGGLTEISFPNNHLVYALTWFCMGLMAVIIGGKLIYDARTRRHQG